MRFGIDCDGVLSQFGAEVIRTANTLWPGKMSPEYVPTNWDYTDALTKDEWKKVWVEIKATHKFWVNCLPYRANVAALRMFMNKHKDADVYFITSRTETVGESVLAQTSKWLDWQDLWPRSGHATVIPVADAVHKSAVIRALQLPFFLDDYATTVMQLQTEAPDTKTYVLDQPWNRHATDLPRVASVAEYLKIVEAANAGQIVTFDVKPRGYYDNLTAEAEKVTDEHARMKVAIEAALVLLEKDMQANIYVFKARTFLRDALPK